MALCCVSGLWLRHNFLNESHSISQGIPSASGSYWHGMMHRREGDYPNAKYWFRRVGEHPVFDLLSANANELAAAQTDLDAAFLAKQSRWDPLRFIDLCEKVTGSGRPSEEVCRSVAHLEWQLLFDYCYRQATGA